MYEGRIPGEDLTEPGRLLIEESNSPRELIVVIRNLALMLEDLKAGKYQKLAEGADGARLPVDPGKLLELLTNRGEPPLGLIQVLMGAGEAQRIMEDRMSDLLELAWQRFAESKPAQEEIHLLMEQVPQFSDRAANLLKG